MMKFKRIVILFLFLFSLSLMSSCSLREKPVSANELPSVPEHAVLFPTYATQNGILNAGTAFILDLEGSNQYVILTATHIFGPSGGLSRQIPSKELPDYILGVKFKDAFSSKDIDVRVKPMYIPGAAPSSEGVEKDIAAFIVIGAVPGSGLKLSKEAPRIGEHVWLATSTPGGAPKEQKLHEAVVTSSSDKELDFKYMNSKLVIHGTSGSPILNSRGEVVGLNVGADRGDGKLIGAANPSSSVARLLEGALKELDK